MIVDEFIGFNIAFTLPAKTLINKQLHYYEGQRPNLAAHALHLATY
jgi:hypothetical protein